MIEPRNAGQRVVVREGVTRQLGLLEEPQGALVTTDVHDQIEWESDVAVAIAAAWLAADLDDPCWTDERLIEWEVAESRRLRHLRRERRARQERRAVADRVQRAALARRLGVLQLERPAVGQASPFVASPLQVMEACAGYAAARVRQQVAAGIGLELHDEPCDECVAMPAGMPVGRYLVLTVAGDSMVPVLWPGDQILVRHGSSAEPGTVVVARHPEDGYVVKAVGRRGPADVELVALNRAYATLRIPRDPALVLGQVVGVWSAPDD